MYLHNLPCSQINRGSLGIEVWFNLDSPVFEDDYLLLIQSQHKDSIVFVCFCKIVTLAIYIHLNLLLNVGGNVRISNRGVYA